MLTDCFGRIWGVLRGGEWISKGKVLLATSLVGASCGMVTCANQESRASQTLKWNFNVGDMYVYKVDIEFPGNDLQRFKTEVTEEIEVLIDHGDGDYRLGVRVQEVNATWKGGEWKSTKPTDLPEEGVPSLVEVMIGLSGKYAGVSVTNRGYVTGSRKCKNKVGALDEPDVRRLGGSGFTSIPFEKLILPKAKVSVGDTWRESTDPIPMGSDVTTIAHEGTLVGVGEKTSEFECKMIVTHKRTSKPKGEWDVVFPNTEDSARVKWRNDVGVLEHCILDERIIHDGKSAVGRKVEVKLLSVVPKGQKK